jgi:hypothetical protein
MSVCALVVLCAGLGAARAAGPSLAGVSVSVSLVYDPAGWAIAHGNTPPPDNQTFTLTCDPPGGTLAPATRLCADIVAHPEAMLSPVPMFWVSCGGGPHSGSPFPPTERVSITVTSEGATTTLDPPGCGHSHSVAWEI